MKRRATNDSDLFDQDSQSDYGGDGKGKIILKIGKLARRAAAVEARKPTNQDIDGETSESSSTTDPDSAHLEELFSAVVQVCDSDGRPLHEVFQLLPSKKRYPTYYDLIETPIDLKMIAMKIQAGIYSLVGSGEYGALSELEKDLLLMCRNACLFNEPGSQIYKDAKTLKKIVTSKRLDIEHGRTSTHGLTPGKTSERIRNKRLRSGLSHAAMIAALQYEDEEDDEDVEEVEEEIGDMQQDDDMDEEDDDAEELDEYDKKGTNPMWILYDSVASIPSSDPFKRLVSRRYYPDYYKEIKNPISLAQIRMRIKRDEYINLTQLQADLNVMFENAKAYNRPDSSLYKTAVKLQKIMQTKVQELLGTDEDSSGDDPPITAKVNPNHNSDPTHSVMESDSDTNPGTGSNNSSFTSDPSPSMYTPLASKSPSNWKKWIKAKVVKDPAQLNTTPGPSFSKGKITVKEEKNINVSSPRELLRKRFMILYRTLMDYVEPDGRVPISIFMEKSSKKLYPDYYKIIADPIDMVTIEANIKCDKYGTTDELLKDLTLMFDNCRQYNEEGSLIYDDANRFEKLINDKIRELGPEVGFRNKPKKGKKNPVVLAKMKKLLDTVRDHRDIKHRQLSFIFQKLPSKAEYPHYYEVIKNPIDLDRIYQKMRTNCYDSLDSLSSDLMLMFDNAYKFNEPDSQVYKDALILQRLALQTKLSLSEDDDGIPDVRAAVPEILLSIFTTVYNHQDDEGRCYSDTMAELPETDEVDGQKVRALSLDLIKSRLDRGFYKRLDAFQTDVFLCLERARNLSRTESQVFEDSIELQSFFITVRDEMCGTGSVLRSPALKYTKADLDKSVEILRVEKKLKEIPQDEDTSLIETKKEETATTLSSSQSECYNEQTYNVGDFIYVSPSIYGGSEPITEGSTSGCNSSGKAGAVKPNVACIQKLWTETDGTKMFEGIFFFRPDQTYHLPTRKFLQKELFRSEVRSTHKMSEIAGKCWVMTVKGKEYFHYAPEGYADEDVYVCEYRYSSRGRCFTKLKSWYFNSDRVKLILRPKPLEPIRVASVFRDRVDTNKEQSLQIEEDSLDKIPKEEFQNVEMMMPAGGKEGFVFYEQYNLPCGPVRAGDYVYVRVESTKKLIARVDTMWSDNNVTNFHGPWFTTLSEVSAASVPAGRVFYKQEIFQSSIEDTNPLLSICGKCCVLDVQDYMKYRPTEVPEDDVYVCESLYEEAKRQIKKLDGLKKISRKDPKVHQDEIYFFRRPIILPKVDIEGTAIPEMPKLKPLAKLDPASPLMGMKIETDSIAEDSLDGSPPSLGDSTHVPAAIAAVVSSIPMTPVSSATTTKKTGKTPGKKIVTGYILYSSEVRKYVAERNPSSSFGEISRIVGNDWRKMSASEKGVYEERAQRMNSEKEEALAAGIDISTPSKSRDASKQEAEFMAAISALKKDPDWIFECCWESCDWQFEDALDLIEHCVQEPKGHVARFFHDLTPNGSMTEGEFQCHWKNCARVKKGVNPFPSLSRLLKHVKDIHIMKGNGRIIHPEMRSKNLMVSRNPKPKRFAKGLNGPKNIPAKFNGNASSSLTTHSPSTLHSVPTTIIPVQPQIVVPVVPPPDPLFVAVPPRPQRLQHSEAYIKYIEAISSGQKHISQWENTLKSTIDNTPAPEPEKLPAQWLANGARNHGTILSALWSLHNFMSSSILNVNPPR